ncbi:DUF1937 family protein [Afipia clevelandensis]|nr:DUF1937 family protein [Afipia clevelandensis]
MATTVRITNLSEDHSLLYLACPYSHADLDVRVYRFDRATEAAAELIKQGRIVFSPITMTHPIDLVLTKGKGTLGSEYWLAFDKVFMDRCDELAVLQIDGWNESNGVLREIEYFRKQNKPIWLLDSDVRLGRKTRIE